MSSFDKVIEVKREHYHSGEYTHNYSHATGELTQENADGSVTRQQFTTRREWPRPIPVSERLPDHDNLEEVFLLFYGNCPPNPDGSTVTRWWMGTHWGDNEWIAFDPGAPWIQNVTHWLPLPPEPKQ